MAAEITLKEVIERLRAEGDLVRNTGTNSIKSAKEILNTISATMIEQTSILKEMLEINQKAFDIQERQDKLGQAGKSVIPPTGGPGRGPGGGPTPPTPPADPGLSANLASLGLLAGAVAVGLGSALGVIKAWVDTIKVFFPKTTAKIKTAFTGFITDVTKTFSNIAKDIRIRAAFIKVSIVGVFDDLLKFVTDIFSRNNTSVLTRAVTSIGGYIKGIAKPFIEIGKMLSNLITGPVSAVQGAFTSLVGQISKFGRTVLSISRIVATIFRPIGIILVAFDTIKGALDGYAEGGILGGFKGAIDGFFTSLITIPLDLIKDMVAWVVEKLGFDETADAIRSFSFTALWKKFTGAIFGFLEDAWEWVKTLFTDPVAALQQLWVGLVGEGGLLDLIWMSVNLAIDWVTKKLGWRDEDAPTFSIKDTLIDWGNSFMEWLNSFLPSFEGIRKALRELVPEKLRGWLFDEDENAEILSEEEVANRRLAELQAQRQAMIDSAVEAASTSGVYFEPDTSTLDREIAELQPVAVQPAAVQPVSSTGPSSRRSRRRGGAEPVAEDLRNFVENSSLLSDVEFASPSPIVDPSMDINERNLITGLASNMASISAVLSELDTIALQNMSQPIIINNTPVTNAPVTNNVGGTNVNNSSVTRITGSTGDGLGRFAN
jgi:hypothetical protein